MDRARARTTWSRWKEAWKEGKGQGTTYIIATAGNVQNSIEITVSAIRRRILSELFTSST